VPQPDGPHPKFESLSSEAQRVNDAFESLKLQDPSKSTSDPAKRAFQFRAVSPDPAAQPDPDLGGASRKSPLRPAPFRPASRRTRQRPSIQPATSQLNGTAVDIASLFGGVPPVASPPNSHTTAQTKCVLSVPSSSA
jgi:hypothetical protein